MYIPLTPNHGGDSEVTYRLGAPHVAVVRVEWQAGGGERGLQGQGLYE